MEDPTKDFFDQTLASEIMLILQGLLMDRRLFISLANGMDERIPLMFESEMDRKYCKKKIEQDRLRKDVQKAIDFSRFVVEKSKFGNLNAKFISYLKEVKSKVDNLNVLQTKKKSDNKPSRLRRKYPMYEIYGTANLIHALLVRFVNNTEKLYDRCQELGISGNLCEMFLSKGYVKQCYIEHWCSPIDSFDIEDLHFRCFVLSPPCDTCSRHFKRCDLHRPICSFCVTLQKKACTMSHRLLCTDPNTPEGIFPLIATNACAKMTTNYNPLALSADEITEEDYLDIYKFLLLKFPVEVVADNIATSASIHIVTTPLSDWMTYPLLARSVAIVDMMRLEFPDVVPPAPETHVEKSDLYINVLCTVQQALFKYRSSE